jgi:hypothetical protein
MHTGKNCYHLTEVLEGKNNLFRVFVHNFKHVIIYTLAHNAGSAQAKLQWYNFDNS